MTEIVIELRQEKIQGSEALIWRARLPQLGSHDPGGAGNTKDIAVAHLFLRVLAHKSLPECWWDVLRSANPFKIVEVPMATPQPQRYVVPEYVLKCIEQLKFSPDLGVVLPSGVQGAIWGVSQLFTNTAHEVGYGVFSEEDCVQFKVLDDSGWFDVDFSDLPLTADNFRENLVKRCQRVGQAIVDAEAKKKEVDPDEGLPPWSKVEEVVKGMRIDEGDVRGRFGELFWYNSTEIMTGASPKEVGGVFNQKDDCFSFVANPAREADDPEIVFSVTFHRRLTSDNLATEIPNRIRLVRQARAKALQEARG